MDRSSLNGNAALLVTDSYGHSVNGISVFSQFFVQDQLMPHYDVVVIFETATGKLYPAKGEGRGAKIDAIYVNAHYSRSDYLVREPAFTSHCVSAGLDFAPDPRKVLISHGWVKARFRWTYYNIYYALRNYSRAKHPDRMLFYDEVVFISAAEDHYRHLDHAYARRNGVKISYYDFSSRFIARNKLDGPPTSEAGRPYVMVIANFENIKNLWWLVGYNLRRRLRRRPGKPFLVLVKPVDGIFYRLFRYACGRVSIRLTNEQQQKQELLSAAAYLLIPSFSEYNPLVALEAMSCGKPVVSVYGITALRERPLYHYLKD